MRLSPLILLLVLCKGYSAESNFWVLTSIEPPFTQYGERGQLEGYTVDMVRWIMRESAIEQKILAAPWERSFKEASVKENVLIFSLARTAEREALFYWITPLTNNRVEIFSLLSSSKGIAGPEQLNKTQTYGVLDGDFRQQLLLDAGITNIVVLDKWEDGLYQLINGSLDNFFYSSIGIQNLCRRLALDCTNLVSVFAYEPIPSYLALSKRSAPQTAARLQQAAQRFKDGQEFEKIANQWVDNYQQQYGLTTHIKQGVMNFWGNN